MVRGARRISLKDITPNLLSTTPVFDPLLRYEEDPSREKNQYMQIYCHIFQNMYDSNSAGPLLPVAEFDHQPTPKYIDTLLGQEQSVLLLYQTPRTMA